MKKNYIILSLLFIVTGAFSQTVLINEGEITINKKPANAWVSVITDDADMVQKSFVSFAKDKYGLKAKKKGSDFAVIEQATIPSISEKQGDLWVAFYRDGKSQRMGMSYLLGYDISINSAEYPAEMKKLKAFYQDFMLYYKTEYYNAFVVKNTERMQDLSSDLSKVQKELKSLSKSSGKVEKSLSNESDDEVKFDLINENIELKALIKAKNEIELNIKKEISKVSSALDKEKAAFKRFETELFSPEEIY